MIAPPIEPMLAKLADELPPAGAYLYEPKWDGFRAIVFRGDKDLYIQSRDSRPLDRYFPELHDALLERLVVDAQAGGGLAIDKLVGELVGSEAFRLRREEVAGD